MATLVPEQQRLTQPLPPSPDQPAPGVSPVASQVESGRAVATPAPLMAPGRDAPEVRGELPKALADALRMTEQDLTPVIDQSPGIESLEIPHTELHVGDVATGVNEHLADVSGQPIAPRYSKSGKILNWLKEKWRKQHPDKEIVER